MKRLVILVLAGLFVAGSVLAQVADLSTLRAKYGAVKAQIEADCGKAKDAAKAGYRSALDAVMASYKAKGNLDAYLAAEKAKKRFDADGKVPEEGNGAVRVYRDAIKKADADALAKTYTLNKNYVAYLEPLIKQLMQADKIDDAKKVKDELDRVKFEMAEVEAKVVTNGVQDVKSEPEAKSEPMLGVGKNKKIVIWNGHNGHFNDAGVLSCDITLSLGGKSVWEKKTVAVPWKPGEDCSVTSDLPAGLRFDKVRVDIGGQQGVDRQGSYACLAEIQVFDGRRNISERCRATASGHYQDEHASYPPERLTDGNASSEAWAKGYWLAPLGGLPSWVEIDLTKKVSGKDRK